MLPQFLILFLLSISTHLFVSASEPSSIYDVLRSNGLPMGLLPNGVKDFSLDEAGRFVVYLDQECNAKFENELHYDRNVSGTLLYGQIAGLSAISAKDLFLWFPVKEIRVDVPSSGLIYFDVGVVYKQFSLSLFESPRDCTALLHPDLQGGSFMGQTVPKYLLIMAGYRPSWVGPITVAEMGYVAESEPLHKSLLRKSTYKLISASAVRLKVPYNILDTMGLLMKKLRGNKVTKRERRKIKRTLADIASLIPVTILMLLP
ncbi:hypothetical protein LOK49_LG12G02416 [Camellia lanceoleosa]|uniref:Uncharacterized protein n=1 Tax=Camellia lanceoleosa TaxID=1840588 RepID=A0ACC0FV80_9ERIC|nr:hypothetical protein LOK49_LG12G02416 [Camellia lanceoleosa]